MNFSSPLYIASQKTLTTIRVSSIENNLIGKTYAEVKNKKLDNAVANTKVAPVNTMDTERNNQKSVEYIVDNSFLSSLFSINNFTIKLFMPRVATDFSMEEKFLKLPMSAIPDVPKKKEITLEENIPNTKLIPTELAFSDSTLYSLFSLSL